LCIERDEGRPENHAPLRCKAGTQSGQHAARLLKEKRSKGRRIGATSFDGQLLQTNTRERAASRTQQMKNFIVSTSLYEFTHGRKPKGEGYWAFLLGAKGDATHFVEGTVKYGEAKTRAISYALSRGYTSIRVAP
jgi:hypothetical protein